MKLLFTSAGIESTSIHNALVDMLGKPIAEPTIYKICAHHLEIVLNYYVATMPDNTASGLMSNGGFVSIGKLARRNR